ncbi:MAG: carboxylesterase family protein [Gammaproteobacteria bacterium]|nr:carboxylesterase family protein [Gammaproteobacteria bacterium]MDH5302904.1 carboxylesterase family protein [Gammaproteobacteria bacterium]MDH5321009.1 carboxylesterase family protein [Gammaproteobacteria bacterium]
MKSSCALASLAMIAVLGLLQACGDEVQSVANVQTRAGLLRGIELENGVRAWLGIPYAAAPVQELRWQPPQPYSWQGTYNADRKMPECMQVLRPHNINHYFGEEATSENCLFMNIWAPADATPHSALPVIVFIYGGGGTIGSSGMAIYDGATVAERGAVFVNFNYRVGLLGFMAHPELTQEQGGHSGNYGYLDQNFALQWIRDNIAQFGGDPAKVLISGQSFGAGSVTQQIFSPLSKGLFSAALMSSGCSWGDTLGSLADGEQVGLQLETVFGVTSLAELRDLPADKIIGAQQESQVGTSTQGLRARGVIDGYFMPASQMEILASGGNSDVPVIAHYNAHESNLPLMRASSVAAYNDIARQMFGDATEEFLALFPVQSDADIWAQSRAAATVRGRVASARKCARLQNEYNDSPAYISEFARKHPYTPGVVIADQNIETIGAYHTADIPYWFGTQDKFNLLRQTRDWTTYDRELSQLMTRALINLLENGDPSTESQGWPAWSPDAEARIVFGDDVQVVPLNIAALEFFATHEPMEVNLPPEPPRVGPRD